jgi:hypothetical protein
VDGVRRVDGVEILWWEDWYDGPLSGVAVHAGQQLWFQAEGDGDDSIGPDIASRRLVLYPLTAEELAAERRFNLLCEKHRGEAPRPGTEWREVWTTHTAKRPEYAARAALGWFVAGAW